MRKIHWRRVVLTLASVTIVLLLYINSYYINVDRNDKLDNINKLIKAQGNFKPCKQPFLPINSSEIMKYIKYVPPIDCSSAGLNWVECEDSRCSIRDKAKRKFGKIKCTFTDLIRKDDYYVSDGQTTASYTFYDLEKSDVVRVSCKSPTGASWKATLTAIRINTKIWNESGWSFLRPNGVKLNVLMLGFDSLSRNTFIRKLPKSYKYLTEILKGHVLTGYNIVGDGTPQALIPILTGKTELELPDTRKRISQTNFVNVYPFIWNDFKKTGYVTGFLEDVPHVGTFTYRLRGFNEPPTDHYMRPYYLASAKEWQRGPKLCAGEIPRHKVMMNHIKHFFSVYQYKPKFMFGFHGELSHDSYNLIGAADDDLVSFLKDLRHTGALNDTLLILMADHGHRFAEIRSTLQGKQEERLPFFSFTFPQSFKDEHKIAYENFVSNLDRLVTPFDIHATLTSLLNLNNIGMANLEERALSLFSKIPEERSCAHAYIEPHWCACMEWEKVSLATPIVERLGTTVTNALNNYTSSHRDLCAILSISQIMWVTKTWPNEKMVKFNKNADTDGFVADMSSKMVVKSLMYQIQVMLIPGNSLFEASITHFLDNDTLDLKLSDVSRINMYGKQARCIENTFPNLRKYCYCKD